MIREALLAQLPQDRANWKSGKADAGDAASILKRVKLAHVALQEKRAVGADEIEMMRSHMSPQQFENFMAAQDPLEMRSGFAVVLKVPWDREHHVLVHFRDGAYLKITRE
ncbi:MAG TPA: hypothetical protein VF669_03970 [Tepidisphaeraceae bacterium]|jgi:hypothetical protein